MTTRHGIVLALASLTTFACARGGSPIEATPVPSTSGTQAPSTPEASAPSAAPPQAITLAGTTDAAPTPADAGTRAMRPVVFHAFRRSPSYGKVDRIGARTTEADGNMDAVFELVVEGDFVGLVVWSEASSFTATTSRPELMPPPQAPAQLAPPGRVLGGKPPRWAMSKHYPVLFPFEDDALVAYEGSRLALSPRTGRRTLRLHTYSIEGASSFRVIAELPDGSYKEGPTVR